MILIAFTHRILQILRAIHRRHGPAYEPSSNKGAALKRLCYLTVVLAAVMLGSVPYAPADPTNGPATVDTFSNFTPGAEGSKGTWVLGSVLSGYVDPEYSPVFVENFEDYSPGALVGQGTWVQNSMMEIGGRCSPVVSAGPDQHMEGDVKGAGGTAANCFFPDIFADGNTTGRIEFDFRRGILELDFLVGPAITVNGFASNVLAESVGGQLSCYNGGCFTPKYRGGYNNPLIIYRLWQPGTFYHLVMDLVRTNAVVTVNTTVDGLPLENLSGITFTNSAPQGINSLFFRGSDYINPVCAIDNIKVSNPFKRGIMPLFPP